MLSVLPSRGELKSFVRRLAWIGNQLFWTQILPNAVGPITKPIIAAAKGKFDTTSPYLTGNLFTSQAIDGAIREGATPTKAWAKYALPKGLPVEGGKVLAIENEPHLVNDFNGVISEGYGKGTKTLLLAQPITVKVQSKTFVGRINYHVHDADKAGLHYDLVVEGIKPGTKQWEMNIPNGPFKGRYALVTTNRGMIVTKMTDQGVVMPKPQYTLRPEEVLKDINPITHIVERKIDGSLGNAHIQDYRVAFRSHREGGETYYDRLPAIEFIQNKSPFAIARLVYPGPKLSGTVLQGELFHPDGAARVSGILNSLPANARAIQNQRGPVKFAVWNILRYKGRDVSSLPYDNRRALYERVVGEIRQVNRNWSVIEKLDYPIEARRALAKASGPLEDFDEWTRTCLETPLKFYERVTSDPLPYGEGIVVKPRDSVIQKWDKLKMTGFHYFKLDEILPGEGKYANSVGRLVVSNPSNGAVGEVGSLSVPDDFRLWMWNNRDDLVGQTVKVRTQEITNRGVPRAGVFYGFHNGEVDLLMQAESMAAGSDRDPKSIMYAMKSANGWRRKS